MITLIRWVRLKQLTIKWQLAIMHELDKQLMTLVKNPEMIEKKIMPYLAEIIHSSVQQQTNNVVSEKK